MALNYSILLLDQAVAGDGTGPFTVIVQQNPTTSPSGGTTIYSNTNSIGTYNMIELSKLGVLAAANVNASANNQDTLN